MAEDLVEDFRLFDVVEMLAPPDARGGDTSQQVLVGS